MPKSTEQITSRLAEKRLHEEGKQKQELEKMEKLDKSKEKLLKFSTLMSPKPNLSQGILSFNQNPCITFEESSLA